MAGIHSLTDMQAEWLYVIARSTSEKPSPDVPGDVLLALRTKGLVEKIGAVQPALTVDGKAELLRIMLS